VALFTSSGQNQVDFTSNVAKVRQALLNLRSRPIVEEDKTCGAVTPYEANLIINLQHQEALALATAELMACYPRGRLSPAMARELVESSAMRSLSDSETQSTAALRGIESIVRRLASLPGERSMIIVSGGFLTETLHFQLDQIIDRALRGGVVINTVDARGLYGDPMLDPSESDFANAQDPGLRARKRDIILDSQRAQANGMAGLAYDTGGVFFENDNDLEAGFRKTAGLADAFYLLAFSPQNLKHDGAFHPIKVKLVSSKGLSVQARHGYYAPKRSEDPASQEREEIREAVFSQEETHNLPIDVHTQFFMRTESDARITVLTSIDLHPLHFRKEEDRNVDKLLFVTVVFDQDGHEISAQEKSVDLRLRDINLERYLQTGITMRTLFDVKPGTYLVRALVRDSESGQISALNRTVEIPY
jgi:VWFA-related protein